MTMWRTVDELDFGAMPLTAAETIQAEQGFFGMSRLVISTRHRARWESGYAAGLHNAQYGSRILDQLRANEQQIADQQERIAELRKQVDGLKRERTAVRRELGEFYCPLYPDTTEGQDLENSGSFWLDQGVNLATLKISELTAELEQARAALRPFAVMGNVYKQYSGGVWGETIDYAEDENDEVQRVLMSDFIHAAAVYQQQAGQTAGSEEE